MAAVGGYLVVAVVTIAVAWLAVGRHQKLSRDPSLDVAEVGGHYVPILGGLAGFAVTGMVLLVTLGRNLPEASTTSYTTVLAMVLVAYIGFFAVGLLFANISHTDPAAAIDVPGAMFAGANVMLFFTIAIGWYALLPLFETFGLTRMADLAGWLLAGAAVASYGLLGSQIYRSGFASGRLVVVIALLGIAATLVYAAIAGWFGLRSADSTLALTITGFILGVPPYLVLTTLPSLVRQDRAAPVLARYGHVGIFVFAQGGVVLAGFLLLSVLGFA